MRKGLLFKNVLKQNIKNYVQTILMICLIVISSLLFMLVLSSEKSLKDASDSTASRSNLHDFIINFDDAQYNGTNNSNYNVADDYYQNALESIANLKTSTFDNSFIWDRVESKILNLSSSSSNLILKAVTDNVNARVDKLVITEGHNIGEVVNSSTLPTSNQIVIEPVFAKKHNLNIGSIIRLSSDNEGDNIKVSDSLEKVSNDLTGHNWFQVVGYGVSADYETPILSQSNPIPDKNNEGIVYIDPSQFGLSSFSTQFNNGDRYWKYTSSDDKWSQLSQADKESYYVGKFTTNSKKDISLISNYLSNDFNKSLISSDTIFNITNNKDNLEAFFNSNNIKNKIKQILSSNIDNQNETNFKNQIINWIKQKNIPWDNRWNINLFQKDSNNNYESIDYSNINSSTKYLYLQISQTLLQGESKINSEEIKINNPFYNNVFNFNDFRSNSNKINQVTIDSINNVIDNNYLKNIFSSQLKIGNTNNYDNLRTAVINIILQNLTNFSYYDDVNSYLKEYLNTKFLQSDNNNLTTSTNNNNDGTLMIGLSDDNSYNVTTSTTISLSDNDFNYFSDVNDPNNKFIYALKDSSYSFDSRTSDLSKGIIIFNTFASTMLIIILIISGIVLFMIIKKNIYYIRKQMGLLKALGYENKSLTASYVALPTYLIIFSTFLAYPLSIIAQIILFKIINDYYNLIDSGFNFLYSLIIAGSSILFLFVFLSIISIFACYTSLKKPVTSVLYDVQYTNKLKTTIINTLKKPYAKARFRTRFNLSMLFKSIDKLVILFITLLFTILIFSVVIMTPNILNDTKKYSLIDAKYNSIVQYNSPIYNSPYSFLKTYNPDSNASIPTTNDANTNGLYIKALEDPNEINLSANYYAPDPSNSLTVGLKMINLNNVVFTNDFLTEMDTKKDTSYNSGCVSAWEDYSTISSIWENYNSNNNIEDIYNSYRQFYIKYKNTILININPNYRINQNELTNYKNIDFSSLQNDINNAFSNDSNAISIADFSIDNNKVNDNVLNSDLTLYNDSNFLNYNYEQLLASGNEDQASTYIKNFNTLFASIYFGRLSEAISQEVYNQSPYNLKAILRKKIESANEKFNMGFNVTSYDPKTDELGLMFNVFQGSKNFNVYGVNSDTKLWNLKDANNNSIQNLIKNSTNNNSNTYNIIINKSLEKKLNWKIGNTYDLSTYTNALNYKNNDIDINDYDTSSIFDGSSDTRNISYKDISLNGFNELSSSNPYNVHDMLSPNYPTPMENALQYGNMKLVSNKKDINVKVVAIDRSYGKPAAYINNEDALNILNYKNSRDFMYNKMFKKEWQNVSNFDKYVGTGAQDILNNDDYNELVQESLNNKIAKNILTMFNNQYPIFNYKMSKQNIPFDYNSSTVINNIYGDYSKLALHGGTGYKTLVASDGTMQWNRYGTAAIDFLLTKDMETKVFDSIEAKAFVLILVFLLLAISTVFIVILTVSDVIFYENKKVMLSMRALGYSSFEVTRSIFGYYLILAIITFMIGMPLTFFLIKWIITSFSSIPIPVMFSWQMPIILFFILFISFTIIFSINFRSINKLSLSQISSYE